MVELWCLSMTLMMAILMVVVRVMTMVHGSSREKCMYIFVNALL
jgi:hypothetical protein